MVDTLLAAVGIVVKEPWADDISYEMLNYTLWKVQDGGDGCGYVALKDNIGVRPDSDTTVWRKAVEAGQSIYDLAVKYGHFDGTEEEFEAQYQAVLQAARDAASATNATNEQVVSAEALRVEAEQNRVSAETSRVSAEESRASAELTRENDELARRNNESGRSVAEQSRATAEQNRVSAENNRVSAENNRANAEVDRRNTFEALEEDMETAIGQADAATAAASAINNQIVSAENSRVSAENGRVTAEGNRVTAEQERATAETSRATAENSRVTAEESRASAETSRATAETNRETRANTDHNTATSDHETAASDHTTASSDHTTAAADHTQAVADHAVMAGYDTRLGNVEYEVSEQTKMDLLEPQLGFYRADVLTLSFYPLTNYVAKLFNAAAGDTFTYTSKLGGGSMAAIIFYDASDNVLAIVSRGSAELDNQVITGKAIAPENTAKFAFTSKSAAVWSLTKVGDYIPSVSLVKKEKILKPKSPNLWDGNTNPGVITTGGGISASSSFSNPLNSGLIPVTPGHYYYLSGRSGDVSSIRCLKADGTTIEKVLVASTGATPPAERYYYLPSEDGSEAVYNGQFKVPSDCVYVQFSLSMNSASYGNPMLEEIGDTYVAGFVPSPYQPYDTTGVIIPSIVPGLNAAVKRKYPIKVLLIGSSHGMNTISQFPWIAYKSGIDVVVGNVYQGSLTLQLIASSIQNGTALNGWFKMFASGGWYNIPGDVYFDNVIKADEWDFIVLQRSASDDEEWTAEQATALDVIIERIKTVATGMPTILFNTGFADPSSDQSAQIAATERILASAKQVSREFMLEYIPVAAAVQNARLTSLASLGNYTLHQLCYDSQHLDYGIGCYVAGATVFEFIFKKFGLSVLCTKGYGSYAEQKSFVGDLVDTGGTGNAYTEPTAATMEIARYCAMQACQAIPLLPIADNLTTDDANMILSAKQGKVLDGKVSQLGQEVYGTPRVDIDFSEYAAALGILQENGTWWVPSVNNFHKVIPVVPGDVYVIVANTAEPSVYALVKSYSPPIDGQAVDLCAGTSVTKLARGTSQTITIPDDCTYIVFNVTMSSIDRTPSAFYKPADEGDIPGLQRQIDEIKDSLDVRATTDLTAQLLSGYIATNGEIGSVVDTTIVSNTGFLHKIVQVAEGDVVTIKGLGASAPRLWCFTDSSYKILSHADASASLPNNTPFTATSDGYFIFNTYNNVSYGLLLTAKTGETYMDKVDQLEQDLVGKLDKSEVALSQAIDFDSGYFLHPSGALNPAPIATSWRRYSKSMIGGGFTILLKTNWYLRSVNKYDKYGNFLENIQYGSTYTGTITILDDDANSHYYQFDAEYTGGSYPKTIISPIVNISFVKTKVDAGANLVELHPQRFGELDLSFDLSGVAPDYPAQPRIAGLANLYALWDDIVSHYGGTRANAATEAQITPPAYMENAQPLYIYKFLSNQSRNDKSKHIKVLVYAGEHVNEYLSHNILLKFMERICGEWATDHNCELLRSMVDWYVLPCINPYGYDFKNSRTNYNNVNINRNFAASNWKSGTEGDNYGGVSAASEFETKIVQYYVEKIKPDIMMDVHTGNTNVYGSIGSLEMSVNDLYFNKMDFYKLASTICRTGSNLFTMANPNYPQNLITPLLDTNVQLESEILTLGTENEYTGLSHQYAMEKGVKLALLIELNQVSNWVNGVYSSSTVGDRAESSAALARGNLLYFIDTMYRAVKAISQNQE